MCSSDLVLQGLKQDDKIVTSSHFMLDSESSQSADLSRINGVEAAAETAWAKGANKKAPRHDVAGPWLVQFLVLLMAIESQHIEGKLLGSPLHTHSFDHLPDRQSFF